MGAHDISFTVDGSQPFSAVRDAFKTRRESDAQENGHGRYSGDFQTVNRVDNHGDKVFDTESLAQDYCLKNAQKWENVIAVRVKKIDAPKPTKAIEKLRATVKTLRDTLRNAHGSALEGYKAARLSCQYMTCRNCKSRLAARYLSSITDSCAVCGESLAARSLLRRVESLQAKLNKANERLATLEKSALSAALAKSDKTYWYVCGWGAS